MDTLFLEDRVIKQRFRVPVAKKNFEEAVAECNSIEGIEVDIFLEEHVKRMKASEPAKFYEGIDADAQYREDFDADNDKWMPIDEFKENVINHIHSCQDEGRVCGEIAQELPSQEF